MVAFPSNASIWIDLANHPGQCSFKCLNAVSSAARVRLKRFGGGDSVLNVMEELPELRNFLRFGGACDYVTGERFGQGDLRGAET